MEISLYFCNISIGVTPSNTMVKFLIILFLMKKLSSEPSGKGHTSPSKNVAGKILLSEYEMPISFQGSVATSQDHFIKVL